MPTLDKQGRLVALLNVTVLTVLWLVPRTRTQGLPPPPLPRLAVAQEPVVYQGHHSQTFHVSHQLPDGEEMQVYLFRNTPQK